MEDLITEFAVEAFSNIINPPGGLEVEIEKVDGCCVLVEKIKLEIEFVDPDFIYNEFEKRFKKELESIPANTEIEKWFKEAIWRSYKIWKEILEEIFKPKLEIELETGVMIPEECIKKCSKKLEDKYLYEFLNLFPEIINVEGTIIKRGDIKKEIEKEFYERKIAESKIVIESYNIGIGDEGIDKLYFDNAEVLLRNEGDASATGIELVISLNEEEIESYPSTNLELGEEKKVLYSFDWISGEISKGIGVEEIAITMRLFGYPEIRGIEKVEKQILAEKNITIPIPIVRSGDTIPEVGRGIDKHNLSLTLLSWRESGIAVDGPYSGNEYYTFTAKLGMKFVILIFKFQNNWTRVQETPHLNAGEIATNKGYIYNMWDSPFGIHSEEYKPRKSTDEEVKILIGDSGSYEDLLPEESTIGRVVFEIPEDKIPIEASIVHIPSLIKYEGELK